MLVVMGLVCDEIVLLWWCFMVCESEKSCNLVDFCIFWCLNFEV